MKKIILSLGFAALALGATAQVKIKDGTVTGSSTTPNSNAILELESNNKGLLYPRVSLTATNAALPGTTMVAGMVVYNTNTVTGTNGVTPGFYYSDGTQWIQLVSSNSLPASTVFLYGAGTPQAAGATCNSAAQNTIYVDTGSASATLGQTWICDGTNWQAYSTPAATEWYLAGSSTADAGANKTANIARAGKVVIGSTGTPARVASNTSGSTTAQQLAALTVAGGDASINSITVGRGGGQISSNIAVGTNALDSNTTGLNNTAIGNQALQSNTTGTRNIVVGNAALQHNTTGNYNVGIGLAALQGNATGSNNIAVGDYTLQLNTSASNNVAIGYQALLNDSIGGNNTAVGYQALLNNLTINNTAVGYMALAATTTGLSNTAVGYQSLMANTTGTNNVAIGINALLSSTSGTSNTAVGREVFYGDTLGNYNVGLGFHAGYTQTLGDYNIAIGANTNLPNTTGNYQLNIGNAIYGTGIDSSVANAANIGINTSTPTSSFQVNGSQSGTIRVQTTSYELTATDYTVIFRTGTGLTATLPSATGVGGRIYRIVNQTAGALAISSTSTITFLNGATNVASTAAAAFQAVTGIWYQIQ